MEPRVLALIALLGCRDPHVDVPVDGRDRASREDALLRLATEDARSGCARAVGTGIPGATLRAWGDRGDLPCEPRDASWTSHPDAAGLLTPGIISVDGAEAWFALRIRPSTFDGVTALRPYVFTAGGGSIRERWRGTALSRPLALARVVDGHVCALLRGDSFLRLDPDDPRRTWTSWAWRDGAFGLHPGGDPARCAEVLDPDGVLAGGGEP